jgi:hypothetical protein
MAKSSLKWSLDAIAGHSCQSCLSRCAGRVLAGIFKLRTLHHDQQGTISIFSVVVLLLLTMLLGLVLNVGEQIDDKIRMQNSADASIYSGGVVVARGMNTIAFTNHLLSEVFALTAYFREGKDRFAESLVPDILSNWSLVTEQVSRSRFERIGDIQKALPAKIEMEQNIVKAFGDMTAKKSQFLLPALEGILGQSALSTQDPRMAAYSHLIPMFQRQVVRSTGVVAHSLSQDVMRRHLIKRASVRPVCLLYTNAGVPGQSRDENDPYERIVPALDPSFEGPDAKWLTVSDANMYQAMAVRRRRELAVQYLSDWNSDRDFDLGPFERERLEEGGRVSAKMSQFVNLWRGFTCAKLNQLLDVEFPQTNLPHMLRAPAPNATQQTYLYHDFTFSAIVYNKQRKQTMPGMYRVANKADAVAFAQVSIFVPRPRYQSESPCLAWYCPRYDWWGKLSCSSPCFDSWPTEWTLFNQNWAARLIPTSPQTSLDMLNMNPNEFVPDAKIQNVRSMTVDDFKAVNTH